MKWCLLGDDLFDMSMLVVSLYIIYSASVHLSSSSLYDSLMYVHLAS